MNGTSRSVKVADKKAAVSTKVRPKAVKGNPGSVGAPMPGRWCTVLIGS